MALNANCVANVTTTGSDDNAGWFDTSSGDAAGGANDRAFSNSPIIIDGSTITASVHTTTTQATLVGHTLALTDRGNVLRISGGTATAGYYRITSVDTANNRVTVDASMGASGATITGRIGGAFASPGFALGSVGGVLISSINLKSGDYTISSTTQNVSNGKINMLAGTTLQGYSNNYRDNPTTMPRLIATGISSSDIVTVSFGAGGSCFIDSIEIDGSNLAGVGGVKVTTFPVLINRCIVRNCTFGFECNTNSSITNCTAISCSGRGFINGVLYACNAIGNAQAGFFCPVAYGCIASGNTGTGFDASNSWTCHFFGCIAIGNGGNGFNGSLPNIYIDCVAINNTGFGFTLNSNYKATQAIRVAVRNNTTGNYSNTSSSLQQNTVTLTADPFVNAAGGDFSLNDVAGGGATLKALNFALPGISTTRYPFGGWSAPKSGGCPLVGHGGLVY